MSNIAIQMNEELAEFLVEHGDLGQAVLDNFHGHLGDATSAMEYYEGEFRNKEEFGNYLLEAVGKWDEIPSWAQFYFNVELWVRDLEWGGEYYFIEFGGYYYAFRSH